MPRPSRQEREERAKRNQVIGRERSLSSNSSIRAELQSPHSDQRGTAPGAMGEVKRSSEEARMQSCVECGYSSGRHSRSCSRKS